MAVAGLYRDSDGVFTLELESVARVDAESV